MAQEPEEGHSTEGDEGYDGGPIKSFLEHLEDLRWALIKCASAVLVGVMVCLYAGNYVVKILMRPLEKAVISYPAENQVVTVMLGTNRLGIWQLGAEQQAAFNLNAAAAPQPFSVDDITDLKALVKRLNEKADGVSAFIAGRLDADAIAGLASASLSPTNSGRYQALLIIGIRRIVQGPSIYEKKRFEKIKLGEVTTALQKRNPQGADLIRLNRLLLEDAFPKELSPDAGRFVTLELQPITIESGTNHVQVMGWSAKTTPNPGHMDISLVVLSPSQAFLVGFRLALFAGLALASPFLFFFLGQFILPALRIHEKKYLYRGLAFAIPLFFSGVCFCYFILMPAALAASQLYANWFGFESTFWEAGEYIGFVSKFMLGMGVGFELPVVILVLVKIGLISYSTLKKARPYMIVINLVLGAVLTTPEVFTQVLMAVPLQILFEISLLIAWYWERQEKKRAAAADTTIDT